MNSEKTQETVLQYKNLSHVILEAEKCLNDALQEFGWKLENISYNPNNHLFKIEFYDKADNIQCSFLHRTNTGHCTFQLALNKAEYSIHCLYPFTEETPPIIRNEFLSKLEKEKEDLTTVIYMLKPENVLYED